MSNRMVTRLAAIGMWFAYGVVFTIACILSIVTAQEIEQNFFPVVSGFQIVTVEHTPNHLIITGAMDKVRNCRFVEAVAYSGGKLLRMRYLDDPTVNGTRTRATGDQVFGPWELTPDVREIRIVSRHACHSFWDSTTTLVDEYHL